MTRKPSPARRDLAEALRLATDRNAAPDLWLAAALVTCWLAAFFDTWVSLTGRWNSDPNYSHGFLVPMVSLYLAAQTCKQRQPGEAIHGGAVAGGLIVLFGMALGYITVLFPSLVAECFSMLTVLAGGVILIGGWTWWKRLCLPLLFLLFMVPWPAALYSRVAFPLQLFVSQIASEIIQLIGIPVLREGNLIHLPRQTMHVAEACSGLRQLTAFLAICTCAALLMRRPVWYRLVVLASSIPIAVAINVLRVTATGLALQYGGQAWTEGTLHTLEGLLMVGLGMGLLLLEIQLLDWLLDNKEASGGQNEKLPALAAA